MAAYHTVLRATCWDTLGLTGGWFESYWNKYGSRGLDRKLDDIWNITKVMTPFFYEHNSLHGLSTRHTGHVGCKTAKRIYVSICSDSSLGIYLISYIYIYKFMRFINTIGKYHSIQRNRTS